MFFLRGPLASTANWSLNSSQSSRWTNIYDLLLMMVGKYNSCTTAVSTWRLLIWSNFKTDTSGRKRIGDAKSGLEFPSLYSVQKCVRGPVVDKLFSTVQALSQRRKVASTSRPSRYLYGKSWDELHSLTPHSYDPSQVIMSENLVWKFRGIIYFLGSWIFSE